jgi:phosphoribosylanthranilate isomerase
MRIKICGITRPEDARFAEEAGADAIGVVVFSGGVSRRAVSREQAREIFDAVGPFTATVAVSHTDSREDLEQMIALHPSAIQISHPFRFEEDPGVRVIRVIGRGDPLPEDCDAVIVDDSHGKGRVYDPSFARDAVKRSTIPVILAGGLTPENVREAVQQVQPYAVDVATGVEISPGIKDHEKIRAFIAASRRQ